MIQLKKVLPAASSPTLLPSYEDMLTPMRDLVPRFAASLAASTPESLDFIRRTCKKPGHQNSQTEDGKSLALFIANQPFHDYYLWSSLSYTTGYSFQNANSSPRVR